LCDETGTLLVCDEIQCGTGRTGRFLMSQHDDIRPDVVTLAKPLAGGLPMGACVVTAELAETLVPGDHGSTFAGGPFVTRAALVVLDELKNGLLDAIATRGKQLKSGLEHLAKDHSRITEVRGRGLMLGIKMESGAPELQKALYRAGLITNCTSGEVVRLLPPYVVTKADVDRALEILAGCLASL
ncbi:MAG: aminotransferase class III-fold pyridoxal phosphate-dependent enzyme, partial [Phycisphaerales bacterium]|nr:aminotransferase class III-fold pyridoxal phosphate-dependent enzyme [Phycisphaerales bacterium]